MTNNNDGAVAVVQYVMSRKQKQFQIEILDEYKLHPNTKLYTRPQTSKNITWGEVLEAYDYATCHPDKYLRGTSNWCAAFAYKLNGNKTTEPRPIGYMNKKDVARLQDEITWDGTHLHIGIDHWAQWQEDTPYEHLQAIYVHPPKENEAIIESQARTIALLTAQLAEKQRENELMNAEVVAYEHKSETNNDLLERAAAILESQGFDEWNAIAKELRKS
jgi:hypothetical protein